MYNVQYTYSTPSQVYKYICLLKFDSRESSEITIFFYKDIGYSIHFTSFTFIQSTQYKKGQRLYFHFPTGFLYYNLFTILMSTLKEDITTTIKNNHGILFAAPQLVGRHTVSLIHSLNPKQPAH